MFDFANTYTLALFVRLQGKSQSVKDELSKLGESMVQSAEGTRAVALELCREFEDKFLAHVTSGEVSDKLELWWFLFITNLVLANSTDYNTIVVLFSIKRGLVGKLLQVLRASFRIGSNSFHWTGILT